MFIEYITNSFFKSSQISVIKVALENFRSKLIIVKVFVITIFTIVLGSRFWKGVFNSVIVSKWKSYRPVSNTVAGTNLDDSLELNQYWLECQNFCNMLEH